MRSLSPEYRQKILVTAETYLALRGDGSPFSPGPAPKEDPAGKLQKSESAGSNPRLRVQVTPTYTEEARRERLSGAVVVGAVVGTDGMLHKPSILQGLGGGLDEQALRVLPLWRFEPGRSHGVPVAISTKLEVSFRLY